MFDLWKDPLTEEQRDELLDKAAHEIAKRKLETPAILFLEMHKPLAYVAGHAALAFAPFLAPFFGFENFNNYSQLLAERDNIERLMLKLEKGGIALKNEEAPCG
jgi:hypothetical protein